jgi:lysophospholipase L1-like esterase
VACGSTPTGPTQQPQPPPPELQAICPAPLALNNVAGPTQVEYVPPQVVGGVAPVSVVCSPASGTMFPVGATSVSCAVSDAAARSTSCSFAVTLTEAPKLAVTQFLAFGDSLTAGEVQDSQMHFAPFVLDPSRSYPTVLQGLLRARYISQSPNVINQGTPGDSAVEGNAKISAAIDAFKPQAVLLMQGIIDISEGGAAGINSMAQALKFDIRDAKRRGVPHVFISTLMPLKDGRLGGAKELVIPANDEIRFLAGQEGAYLVDAYAAMIPQVTTLIGGDGLHPTAEGYRVLAQTFFDEIKRRLETPATPPPLLLRMRR